MKLRLAEVEKKGRWNEKVAAKLAKAEMNSSYVRKMAVLSAKIFGNLPRPASERSAKVIALYKQQPQGSTRTSYYPPLSKFNQLLQRLRFLGIYHDEHLDFKEEMAARRRARGKIAPKKGEGKRSKKKK